MASLPLAVDIGSYSIKMAMFAPTRPLNQLEVLAAIRTPPGAVRDCEVIDSFEVAESLRELMAATGIRPGQPVVTAVGGPRVNARAQTFPAMPLAKLRQAVKFEAEKWMPFPVQDSIVEPQVIAERATDEGRLQDVVVVAAPKSAVSSRVEALRMAGLRPVEVDVEPFALVRTLVYGTRNSEMFTKTVAIIRLGDTYSDITIVRRGSYVLSRPLPVAGTTFTKAVAQALSMNYHEAEWAKETRGAAVSEAELIDLPEEERSTAAAITRDMDELSRELKLSVNFFQSQYQEQSEGAIIHEVLVTGGSAMLRGIDRYLARALGTPASVTPYFDLLSVDTSRFDPEYVRLCAPSSVVAVGLALAPLMESRQYAFSVDPGIFGVDLGRRQQQAQPPTAA